MKNNYSKKIAIALSGGVDSAVAAKILQDEGHEIFGLFLKLWKHDGIDTNEEKARKVADFLQIPFHVIDARKKFKDIVVANFVNEYKSCRTPNPCTLCNSEIKFKLLIDKARELGCKKVATGHYARIENSEITNIQETITNKYPNSKYSNKKQFSNTAIYHLLAGVDDSKDQSYMLYRLTQDQLSKVIFPLGEMTKKEVKEMAKRWGLPVAEQKESQEICFLQNIDYRAFLQDEIGESYFKKGDIVDTKGNIVGKHEGLINYTIGQRKSINQNSKIKNQNDSSKSKNIKPLYTVGFDVESNCLIVGDNEDIFKKEMIVGNLNWIRPKNRKTEKQKNIKAKIRSQANRVKCRIKSSELRIKSGTIKVLFDEPQRAITPGQSAVFYNGDEVLGGGTIIK